MDIRAFYKRVFRLPTFNDLYYTFVGNINLKPESTTQYNLGAVFSHKFKTGFFKTLDASLDLYYNTVKNKIVAVPTSNQFRWTMLNFGRVEIKGLDAVLQSSFATGPVDWTTRVNYTYQRAEDVTDKNSQWYRGQIPYIPWHSGSVIVTADYGKWALTYSFIYTGERYESVANIAENYSPAWYTHDMGITRSFSIGPQKRDLKITLEVNNILNQQYEVVQCYPMPGTNIKLRLNFEL